ncbi:undecaprenyl-diphosphate phosphatase [bacterium]|nr:undecaprenyl-diphosphate phosphatase [bacterium]
MEIIEAIILGIIQGLTEFLPVSSSGHLEIIRIILDSENVGEKSMIMTVVLHGSTALSTIFIFRRDITGIFTGMFSNEKKEFSFAWKIFLSMIPATIVGLIWEDHIESLFEGNLQLVGGMLIFTALLLYFADKAKSSDKKISPLNAIIIGVSQAIAIIPGISRSGATISTSVLLGIDKTKSARFSFLMVVPLIMGKMGKDILSGDISFTSSESIPLLFGFISAFIVGIIACKWMIRIVRNSNLRYFSLYCIIIGFLCIIYSIYA